MRRFELEESEVVRGRAAAMGGSDSCRLRKGTKTDAQGSEQQLVK